MTKKNILTNISLGIFYFIKTVAETMLGVFLLIFLIFCGLWLIIAPALIIDSCNGTGEYIFNWVGYMVIGIAWFIDAVCWGWALHNEDNKYGD